MKEPTVARRVTGRLASVAAVSALSLVMLTACNGGTTGTAPATTPRATTTGATTTGGAADSAATATLRNADGADVGTATFTEADEAMQIEATVTGLEPGFYGFHIHGIGLCEPNSAAPNNPQNTGNFLSAGGHLGADQGDHPEHKGDLPALLVMNNGEGRLSFATDRVTVADFTDADGAALMIHGGRDNFANVPERYAPGGPDNDTRGTGDAGSRLACGVIETNN